jgi:hypothetical protein
LSFSFATWTATNLLVFGTAVLSFWVTCLKVSVAYCFRQKL